MMRPPHFNRRGTHEQHPRVYDTPKSKRHQPDRQRANSSFPSYPPTDYNLPLVQQEVLFVAQKVRAREGGSRRDVHIRVQSFCDTRIKHEAVSGNILNPDNVTSASFRKLDFAWASIRAFRSVKAPAHGVPNSHRWLRMGHLTGRGNALVNRSQLRIISMLQPLELCFCGL